MNRGFVINSFWDDHGPFPLEIFGVGENGPFLLRFNNQEPLFFVSQKAPARQAGTLAVRSKDLPLKSFDGEPVKALYFKSLQKLYEARDKLAQSGERSYENDIRPESRFLMERFINGPVEFQGPCENSNGLAVYTNPAVKAGSFKPLFSTLSLDIETGRDGSLYSIGLSFKKAAQRREAVFMLGESDKQVNDLLVLRNSETKLLEELALFVRQTDPDLLLGWHIAGFDLRFLSDKARALGVELKLGRDESPLELQERGNAVYATIKGRIVLDGPPVLRANFFRFTNMKLDTVANEVLGAGKDISSTGLDKVNEIERRFREDKEALAFYNIEDCRLVAEIFEKLDIVNLLYSRALFSGQQMDKVGFSTGAFDHFFLPRLHRKGFVAPNVLDMNREEQSAGGMVIEPVAGLYRNVAVFDFKSLYPSIIRTFCIDPLSRLQSFKEPLETPSGIRFSRTEHILPSLLDELTKKRSNAKANGNASLSQAIKILMNSFYGVMGSPRSRFYHADLPTAITTSGHWVLNQSISFFDNLGLKVIYGDTDSLFVLLENGYENQEKAQAMAEDLNYYLGRLARDQFGCESRLEVELEKIYEQIFFSAARGDERGAKKRYVGWKNREMEFVGMEYVRSDWTDFAKEFQFALFQRLFENEPLEIFIKEEVKKLEAGFYDEKLVYRKKLSKKVEEYTKSAPPHIKAAMLLPESKRKRLRSIRYVMTVHGPKPAGEGKEQLDYSHYIEKQLRPVAQTVLQSQGLSFDDVHTGNQLSMF